ncbi:MULTISPECIES: hypothetical protein [unclassified Mycobacterium]|uniref:hypothetical protein n=1 Tax=unclassified Mycobacterium TaxID=2642494 RepID=UPI0029C697ED|nr:MULTISPECIES: hypothetical protein [unclassified Mycobacterium]
MGVFRFVWRGVLAFDRIGRRVPQLVQIWLVEFLFAIPLTFFIAKVIDIRGAFGVPGSGDSLGGAFWGALAVALVCGFFFVKSLVRPRLVKTTWTPMVHADVGPVTVYGGNRAWSVEYDYLTSHPSYILLHGITIWIPIVMVWMTIDRGDDVFYWKVAGYVGLAVLALMALTRLLTWYVFRLGRGQLDAQLAADNPISARKLSWEVAWKPLLMLLVLIYAFSALPVGYMWWKELRTIDGLPVVTAEDGTDHVGEYVRVEGELAGEPVWWAPRGTGRGGNNFSGAGVLVNLESGGDVLLLAESLSVPDFLGVMKKVRGGVGGEVKTHGRVIDYITEDQEQYYGFSADDFDEPPSDGRVMVLLEYP